MVEVDSQRLRIGELRRGGDRPLLLFNGFGAPLETAKIFSRALSYTDILTFDIPGVGGSPATLGPYRLSHITRMTARLLDRLEYETIDVLGISWGGGVAQQFARDFPVRCRRLILVVTSAGMFMVPGKPSMLLKMIFSANFRAPYRLAQLFSEQQGDTPMNEGLFSKMLFERIDACDFRGHLYQLLATWGWTSIHWLHRLKQPTLVLSGKDDPIVPPINGKILAKRIPKATLRTIKGGHLFLMNRPESAAGLVEDFLRGKGEFA
jgi:poly(3-hydroxyalkanoate) depolymerase